MYAKNSLTPLRSKINENFLLYPFLGTVLLYIIFYGIFVTEGFVYSQINPWFLVIFIPIILIDVLKTSLETSSSTAFKKRYFKRNVKDITVIIPTMNGEETLERTLQELLEQFPPDQVIVASNGSTDRTCDIARQYKVQLIDIDRPIGKIEAINYALSLVKTKQTLTIDDDVFVGHIDFSSRELGDAAGLAFRVYPRVSTWITKLEAHEYRKSMDIGKNYHNPTATVHNISGAIGLFKTDELRRQITLHTGEFSGEDLQRTLLIHLSKNNKVRISHSIVETDVPNTLASLFHQRVFGWGPGLIANSKNLFKLIISPKTHFKLRYEAFYTLFLVLFIDPLRLVAIPILVWYPVITIVVYVFYVILESIPYIKMGKKEPLWVIFAIPFYGLLNFLARTAGFLVFLYRRIAVKLAHETKLDNYKLVGISYRIVSLLFSYIIFIGIVSLVAYLTKPLLANEFIQALIILSFFL